MKYLFLLCFVTLPVPFLAKAQSHHLHDTTIITVPQMKNDNSTIYTYVEKQPSFPGDLETYIKQQLHHTTDSNAGAYPAPYFCASMF